MWYRNLISLLTVFLIAVGIAVSFIFYPILYIVWGIYNRNKISLWLSLVLTVVSVVVSYLYYRMFSLYTQINWLDPLNNPFFLFGAFLTVLFLITRSPSKRLSSKQRYYLSFILFILQIVLLLTPVLLLHHVLQKRNFEIHIPFLTEAAIVIWVSLVIYLFIKYPEDILVSDFYRYISKFHNQIRDDIGGKK